MIDLKKDLEFKINQYFKEKKFTKIEKEIKKLGSFENLSPKFLAYYALSKSLNSNSTKSDFQEAAYLFEKIYNINQNNVEAIYNLIICATKAELYLYLKDFLEKIYKNFSNDLKINEGLSKVNFYLGNTILATKYYKKILEINPNNQDFWSKFLASNNYNQVYSQEEYLVWCKKFDNISKPKVISEIKVKKKDKINLGFVSSDFRSHSVGFFLKDVIIKINKNKFNLFAYNNLVLDPLDGLSKEIKSFFNGWTDAYKLKDKDLIDKIRNDNIDILIDLSGYTQGNRINIFKARSAPIQISWLGYCNSLGLENIDYLIADPYLIPENEYSLYTEKIIEMPKIWNALAVPKKIPNVSLENFNSASFDFGCLNNFQKISDRTVEIWSLIMNKTKANLVLKSSTVSNDDLSKNLIRKFEKHKVDIKRLKIFQRVKGQNQHLEFYNKFHMSLDTFPYPGVTTSFESVLMGKPFLTLAGNNFNSRCGKSINLNLGLEEFIAKSEDEYIEKALYFYRNPGYLFEIVKNLRTKALASSLFDTSTFTKSFTSILQNIYKNHL
ncbi:peptide transporter [Candidatus Pelagibacter sp.]|jgi:protein O-GlcNAc transferase|nr:peptide transporter [Candidatus Pelagibacter sp.]